MSTFENIAEEFKKLRPKLGREQAVLAPPSGVSFATVNRSRITPMVQKLTKKFFLEVGNGK